MDVSLCLSSGFLAFARHAGFLMAVEERAVRVNAITGTSSGSVVAALWASGMPAAEITALFTGRSLMSMGRPNLRLWQGLMTMAGFMDFIRPHLRGTVADLEIALAVGVVDRSGAHDLITAGPLAEVVAASCAMPGLFAPVTVNGRPLQDGGAADRLGLGAHRAWRPGERVLAHWVERTAGKDVDAGVDGVTVVRTPRSRARFWNLGDVPAQAREALELSRAAFDQAGLPRR